MGEVKMVGLKIVVESDDGEKEIEIKESDTRYWEAIKKLLEESFTSPGTKVPHAFVPIGEPKK